MIPTPTITIKAGRTLPHLLFLIFTLVLVIPFLQPYTTVEAFSLPSLNPSSTPEQVIQSQLAALKSNDMSKVFRYASPSNKDRVGGDVQKFDEMVRSGPYRFLVGHRNAEILLVNDIYAPTSRRFLVRVVPDETCMTAEDNRLQLIETTTNNSLVHDYWWVLSRSRKGPDVGCYMVDAVLPNS